GDDLVAYARELYAELRAADTAGADRIVAVMPPPRGLGHAVRDRLTKAAHPSVWSGRNPAVALGSVETLGCRASETVELGDPGVAHGVEVGDGAAVDAAERQ